MAPNKLWRQRSRRLAVLLCVVTVPPAITLVWLGAKLHEQDRVLTEQQAAERRQTTVNTIVRSLDQSLTAAERSVVGGALPGGMVRLVVSQASVQAEPPGSLLWGPAQDGLPSAIDDEHFQAAERMEFNRQQSQAIAEYEGLAGSPSKTVRAGALLRLGRVHQRQRNWNRALDAYRALATINGVSTAGGPSDLQGRRQICDVLALAARMEELAQEATALESDLNSGRWSVDAPTWELTRLDLERWLGRPSRVDETRRAVSVAAQTLWDRRQSRSPAESGRFVVRSGDSVVTVLESRRTDGVTALVVLPQALDEWVRIATDGLPGLLAAGLKTTDGLTAAGVVTPAPSSSVEVPPSQTALPWTVIVATDVVQPGTGELPGRTMVFAAGLAAIVFLVAGGAYMLWRVMQRVLLKTSDGFIEPSDWSPDGKQILAARASAAGIEGVLVSVSDGSVRRLRPASGNAATLASIFSPMAFSPNGSHVAFGVNRPAPFVTGIAIVNLATGQETLAMAEQSVMDQFVGWSKAGDLVFVSGRSGADALWTAPFANGVIGAAVPLALEGRDFRWPLGLSASDAFYYKSTPREFTNVKLAGIDFAAGAVTSAPASLANQNPGIADSPVLSNDGRHLASVAWSSAGQTAIVVTNTSTGSSRELRTEFKALSNCRWIPDNSALVCNCLKDLARSIQRIDARTGEAVLLAPYSGYVQRFSPDGKKVYLSNVNVANIRGEAPSPLSSALVELDLASKQERVIFRSTPAGEARLALSADASTVYYRDPADIDQSHRLIARDVATGKETELLGQRRLGGLKLSPDGRFIVTTPYNNNPTASLLLMNSDGSGVKDLGQGLWFAAWAPDSKSIIAAKPVAAANTTAALWWVPLDGRAPRQLDLGGATFDLQNFWTSDPDFSVRAGWLAFTQRERATGPDQVWMLENFLPKAVRR